MIESLKRLDEHRSFSVKVFITFVEILKRVVIMSRIGTFGHEYPDPNKVYQPLIDQVYKKSQESRIPLAINKSTRLIAESYGRACTGRAIEKFFTGIIITAESNVPYWL